VLAESFFPVKLLLVAAEYFLEGEARQRRDYSRSY
jgi:hypothetical protein